MLHALLSRNLLSFLTAAHAGSLNRAAEVMHISPNSLAEQIDLLESRLKLKLFVRTHRGLKLTPEGSLLLTRSEELKDRAETLLKDLCAIKKAQQTIKIGTSPVISGREALKLYEAVHYQIPDILVSLIPFDNEEMQAFEILNNFGENIDLVAGLYDERFLKRHHCTALKIRDTPLGFSVPKNHPLAARESLSLEDLRSTGCLFLTEGTLECTDAALSFFKEHGLEGNIESTGFTSIETFNRAYREGLLVLNVREWEKAHPLFCFVPADWELTGAFGLIHSRQPCRALTRFLEAVTAYLQNAPATVP